MKLAYVYEMHEPCKKSFCSVFLSPTGGAGSERGKIHTLFSLVQILSFLSAGFQELDWPGFNTKIIENVL